MELLLELLQEQPDKRQGFLGILGDQLDLEFVWSEVSSLQKNKNNQKVLPRKLTAGIWRWAPQREKKKQYQSETS